MHTLKSLWSPLLLATLLTATVSSRAADAKTYQVTGPVTALTPTTITVQKGDEKWELARTKNTKITGDLKVGAKVTVYYSMKADEVEVKEAKSDAKPKAK